MFEVHFTFCSRLTKFFYTLTRFRGDFHVIKIIALSPFLGDWVWNFSAGRVDFIPDKEDWAINIVIFLDFLVKNHSIIKTALVRDVINYPSAHCFRIETTRLE